MSGKANVLWRAASFANVWLQRSCLAPQNEYRYRLTAIAVWNRPTHVIFDRLQLKVHVTVKCV